MFVVKQKGEDGVKFECLVSVPRFGFHEGDKIFCSTEELETAREICSMFFSLPHDMAVDYVEGIDKSLTKGELDAMRITMINQTIAIDQGLLGDDWEDDRPQESVDKYNEWKKNVPQIEEVHYVNR